MSEVFLGLISILYRNHNTRPYSFSQSDGIAPKVGFAESLYPVTKLLVNQVFLRLI